MRSALIWSTIAAVISANSALGLESTITVRSSLSASDLWSKIGDFCGVTAWDPAVERCDLSADGKKRTVVFFGGVGSVAATLEDWDDSNRSFSWAANAAFAPISNYRARVRVLAEGPGSTLQLAASYEANGISDAEAKKVIDDAIYRGLCFSSPFACSKDQVQFTPAQMVEFDGLSMTSKRFKLRGYLRRPDTAIPAPAVVLLHGCGGFAEALDQNWGARIVGWGYVTLTLDSFGPRGLKNTCTGSSASSAMAFDPYQALKFLVEQKFVDPKKVIVLGFSQGGWLGLSSVERGPIETAAARKFVAAAAFYPVCRSVKGPMTVPTLIMIGESDDWTPSEACRKLANGEDELGMSRVKGEDTRIKLVVYPNAFHGFDLPNLKVPIKYFGHHHEYNKEATDEASEVLREFFQSMIGNR
jgi:dienelactone hydrolase